MRALVGLLSPLCLLAACTSTPEAPTTPQAEIATAEAQLGKAMRERDIALLDRLLAPEFRQTGGPQGEQDRSAWLGNLYRVPIRRLDADVSSVVVTGDTAVAEVQTRWDAPRRNVPGPRGSARLRDTWEREGGTWRLQRREVLDMSEAPSPDPR